MNTPILDLQPEIDALSGDLTPCEPSPRPIRWPIWRLMIDIGGRR